MPATSLHVPFRLWMEIIRSERAHMPHPVRRLEPGAVCAFTSEMYRSYPADVLSQIQRARGDERVFPHALLNSLIIRGIRTIAQLFPTAKFVFSLGSRRTLNT